MGRHYGQNNKKTLIREKLNEEIKSKHREVFLGDRIDSFVFPSDIVPACYGESLADMDPEYYNLVNQADVYTKQKGTK